MSDRGPRMPRPSPPCWRPSRSRTRTPPATTCGWQSWRWLLGARCGWAAQPCASWPAPVCCTTLARWPSLTPSWGSQPAQRRGVGAGAAAPRGRGGDPGTGGQAAAGGRDRARPPRADGRRWVPGGLHGVQIPLEARIIAVADTYDVLVTDRPYRKAYPLVEAVRILRKESGTHLYRPAVQALLRVLARNTTLRRKAS